MAPVDLNGSGRAPLGHEQGRVNRFAMPGGKARVLGISSGKGGVGKSSITVNLAVTLAAMGSAVGVLDADVYGFSVPTMLGISSDPTVQEDRLVPPESFGVRCMSMGFFVGKDQPVLWRGPMLHKALEQFLVDVEWGDLDFLLIDMPPGTGDVALSIAQYLPACEIYVVTTPQVAAARVAQRMGYLARKLKLPLQGVVENMSWFTGEDGRRYELFGSGGGQVLADELGVPLVGQVPLVPSVREAGDTGRPISAIDPTGEAGSAFATIGRRIVGRPRTRIFRSELAIH